MGLIKILEAEKFSRNYEKKVREAANYISWYLDSKNGVDRIPEFCITLGSGLSDIAKIVNVFDEIPYHKIPNFPECNVDGHSGKLIIGSIKDIPVIVLSGRKHYYEVADESFMNGLKQVVFPVHVMAELKIENYFATNAAGGLNTAYNVGDMMIIEDHINMIPNPLAGRKLNFKTVGGKEIQRFQSMLDAYSPRLTKYLSEAAVRHEQFVHYGKYLALTGPTYETSSESLFYKNAGADAVGMSTAPEVIVANNRGMNCVGFSCITNKIAPDGKNPASHEEVMAVLKSEQTKKRFSEIVLNFFNIYNTKWCKENK